ncbi:hypothetical protein KKF91_14395 [Myxococcota bacterium]|nr:hypothetical protein [Myxococcota bacterium]MBU1431731.1 hypothetical protein [Myxococcota bacterium]MBU1899742.1 hypothetical protein [Myxococcota bacterium]
MISLRRFFSVLCLCGAMSAWGQPITIVTLGDSLTHGDGDVEGGGGYPARILKKLRARSADIRLINLAQSGVTTGDLINMQLDPALAVLAKAPPGSAKFVLLWIGSNDLFGLYNYVCDQQYPNDYVRCERESEGFFIDNLDSILKRLQASGARVYVALLDDQSKRPVMTNQQLRESAFDRFSASEVPRMATQIARYNDDIRKIASRRGAFTVDFSNSTLFQDIKLLDGDGNHPNAQGYDLIAEVWFKAISLALPPLPATNPTR